MPKFDGTGPRGQGAMTGGGRGYCSMVLNDSNEKSFSGYGYCGAGRRQGFRNQFYMTGRPGWMRRQRHMQTSARILSKEDETMLLKNQAESLKKQLETVQEQLRDLENQRKGVE